MFDLNNFLIDRCRRGTMFSDTTGEALWSITQIKDASLSMTSETSDVVDALNNVITQFDRAKNATFSGTNALWDLGLSAAQFGSEKQIADADNKIVVPMYEQIKVASGKVVLKNVPVGVSGAEIKYVYVLNSDSTLGEKYTVTSGQATGKNFTLSATTKTITMPSTVADGTTIAVFYEAESENAIAINNNASEFPKAGRFHLEVIGKDTCDKTAVYVATIVFPNAKLQTEVDLSFTSDGGHPFSMTMMQDYCDLEKRLFTIYIAK